MEGGQGSIIIKYKCVETEKYYLFDNSPLIVMTCEVKKMFQNMRDSKLFEIQLSLINVNVNVRHIC